MRPHIRQTRITPGQATLVHSRTALPSISPGLRWSGAWSQIIDQPQDFSEQVTGHGDFRHLERDIATMR